jgi:hypothetical protein
MLFKDTTAVYCENRTKHTLWQNAEFQRVKAGGSYSDRLELNG